MISIRQSMFETNSSSTHVFCIPGHKSLKIPKEIKLSQLQKFVDISDNKQKSIEDKLAYMYDKACDNNAGASFIEYLQAKGITVINDTKYEFDGYMFNFDFNENDLDNFLFNDDAKTFYVCNEKDEKNVEKLQDEGYKIIEIRE